LFDGKDIKAGHFSRTNHHGSTGTALVENGEIVRACLSEVRHSVSREIADLYHEISRLFFGKLWALGFTFRRLMTNSVNTVIYLFDVT
jgi:hypothetical protein